MRALKKAGKKESEIEGQGQGGPEEMEDNQGEIKATTRIRQ